MLRRSTSSLALIAALLCAPACTRATSAGTQVPALSAPQTIVDLDDYARARNAYALVPLDDPARGAARDKLATYLIGYLDHALEGEREEATVEALEQLCGLWIPAELRTPSPRPELAAAALRVYDRFAPAGAERPALLALALAQAFASADQRAEVERDYDQLYDWIVRTSMFDRDPRAPDQLERLLEDVSSLLPSPFLVDALAAAYLERYRAAQLEGRLSEVSDPRVTFAPYLLARNYLLADDFDAAIEILDRLGGDASMQVLRELIVGARDFDGQSTADIDQLIAEFLPEDDNRLPEEIARQSWGIIDNLARRTLAQVPDHAPAHLARGRVLRSRSYVEAAIVHYERAFASKTRASSRDDLWRGWSELAELYQYAVDLAAERADSKELAALLATVEGFHARARETWPQRQLEPDITLAWMTVAFAEFNAGHVDQAQRLLDEVVLQRLQPEALSLLATIALRRGSLDQARAHYGRLDELSAKLGDQLDRYDWQIDAHLGLAEVESFAGQHEASVEQLREGLRQLNTLLSYPGLPDSLRTEFGLRRARVFFALGEIELAMEDVRTSQRLTPEREDAFTEPLLFTVTHGLRDAAEEIFVAALARDGEPLLGLYYSLWIYDLGLRLDGAEPNTELAARARARLSSYASDDDADPWPRKLAAHALGQLDDQGLIAAAGDPRQRSEAYFYAALGRWRRGSHEASLGYMSKVIEQQMMGDFEYRMAQRYLHFAELPQTARAF